MPGRNEQSNGNADPHVDGRFEGVINDSTASASEQMGVRADSNQNENPFHAEGARSRGLEKFERFTRGNRTKDEELDK